MLYISYPSALYFWLNTTNKKYPKSLLERIDFSTLIAETSGDTLGLPEPVTIMTSCRKNVFGFKCKIPYSHLPQGNFVKVTDNVAVASPEFCFLEAARYLPFPYLVELGNCLCGKYVLDASSPTGQRSREPVTSNGEILKFLQKSSGSYGIKLALRAAKYVFNNANSPMESRLAAIFFIPRHDGGMGLIRGELNGQLKLAQSDYEYLRAKSCCADILWEKQKVAFEYDSTLTHLDASQHSHDTRRQTIMNRSNYKVVRWNRDQLLNFTVFEEAVMIIWKELGMKNRSADLKKYRDLRSQIFMKIFKEEHYFC